MAVRFEGLDLVLSNLARVAAGYSREQVRIHKELGEPLQREARQRVRVLTGRLRSSITLDVTDRVMELTAGEGLNYAGYQHWGTRYISPNRFLTEPFHDAEGRMVRDYETLTDQFIERTWRDG